MSEENIHSDSDEDNLGAEKSVENYKESDFMDLNDLVYAPLHALAKSNQQLRASVVEGIKSMGTIRQNGQDESVHLDNLNIAYEQVRQEGEEGYSVENLQMQVPMLSIVPITNLNVEKAQIDFFTEVKAEIDQTGQCKIMARICSPEQRESNNLPRVSYKLKISSMAATEGIMRITDLLSSSQVAKKLDTTPVAIDGNLATVSQKDTWQEASVYKTKVKKLKQLHQKISEMLTEQERLHQISEEADADNTHEYDKEKYLKAQADIAKRIMEYQEQIMNREITFGLDHDYEE